MLQYHVVSNKILKVLNEDNLIIHHMQKLVHLVHDECQADFVGVRVKKNCRYPFIAFTEKNNSDFFGCSDHTQTSGSSFCQELNGIPLQNCACHATLTGNLTNISPVFDDHGSFLLSDDTLASSDFLPNSFCALRRYKSILLVPVRTGAEILGALQICAEDKQQFHEHFVQMLEDISYSIASLILRNETRNKLIEKEQYLLEVQKLARVGSYSLDFLNGQWTSSKMLDEIFGLPVNHPKNVAGWLEIVHPEHRNMMENYFIHEVVDGHQHFDKEYKIKRIIDGEERWVHGYGRLSFAEDGKPSSMMGTIMDITEKKQAEIERTNMMEKLQYRNHNLEQFSYIVSHNLRAPLNNMMGLTNFLAESDSLSDENREMVENLQDSIKKMDTIISDIYDIMQVTNVEKLPHEILFFSDIIGDIIVSVDLLLKKENAVINTSFHEEGCILSVKAYLHSIFYNLILNGIKYRKPNVKPVIEITSSNLDNKHILIKFTDNGLGMDLSEKRDQIFGLYKRFHNHVEGRGMGLFMVKAQTEALGGSIDVTSELGTGTTFSVVLPVN